MARIRRSRGDARTGRLVLRRGFVHHAWQVVPPVLPAFAAAVVGGPVVDDIEESHFSGANVLFWLLFVILLWGYPRTESRPSGLPGGGLGFCKPPTVSSSRQSVSRYSCVQTGSTDNHTTPSMRWRRHCSGPWPSSCYLGFRPGHLEQPCHELPRDCLGASLRAALDRSSVAVRGE
jgi:hypothetical protein